MPFSQSERIDMLLIYGECRQNCTQARNLYAERYPERRHPSRRYFTLLEQHMRRERQIVPNFIINEELEVDVLAAFNLQPTKSVREVASELNTSREAVRRILKKHKFKPYKFQIHEHLYEADFLRRVRYCEWLVEQQHGNIGFVNNILFSDESSFTNLGLFNRNNSRYWSVENPGALRQGRYQVRFSLNVWLGIMGTRQIGPIIFDGALTSERYLQFLQNEIENDLEDLPVPDYFWKLFVFPTRWRTSP